MNRKQRTKWGLKQVRPFVQEITSLKKSASSLESDIKTAQRTHDNAKFGSPAEKASSTKKINKLKGDLEDKNWRLVMALKNLPFPEYKLN